MQTPGTLAKALLIRDPVIVATHDRTMALVAEHLGLAVTDPVQDDPGSRT